MESSPFNALFYVGGSIGFRYAIATSLDHGISIVETAAAKTRRHSVWFARTVTSGSFDVSLAWKTERERDGFLKWIEDYVTSVSDPNSSSTPMMSVFILRPGNLPQFSRAGIPSSGMAYDYVAGTSAHRLSLTFMGTGNRTFESLKTRAPGDPVLEALYPGGYETGNDVPTPSLYNLPSEVEIQRELRAPQNAWFARNSIANVISSATQRVRSS